MLIFFGFVVLCLAIFYFKRMLNSIREESDIKLDNLLKQQALLTKRVYELEKELNDFNKSKEKLNIDIKEKIGVINNFEISSQIRSDFEIEKEKIKQEKNITNTEYFTKIDIKNVIDLENPKKSELEEKRKSEKNDVSILKENKMSECFEENNGKNIVIDIKKEINSLINNKEEIINNPIVDNREETKIKNVEEKNNDSFPLGSFFTLESILPKLGILFLLIGIALLFKFTDAVKLLTKEVRVGAGILSGITLMALSYYIKEKGRKILAEVVAGGSVAVLYMTIFSAFYFYSMLNYKMAFICMLLITLTAYVLSFIHDSVSLSIVAFSGGMAIPFVLFRENGSAAALVMYNCFMITGAVAVFILKGWRSILWVSVILSWLILSVLVLRGVFTDIDKINAIFGIGFHWIIFYFAVVVRKIINHKKNNTINNFFENDDEILTVLMPFLGILLMMICAQNYENYIWGTVAFLASLIHLFSALILKDMSKNNSLYYVNIAMFIGLIGFAIIKFFTKDLIIVGFFIETVMIFVVYKLNKDTIINKFYILMSIITKTLISIRVIEFIYSGNIDNKNLVVYILIAVIGSIVAYYSEGKLRNIFGFFYFNIILTTILLTKMFNTFSDKSYMIIPLIVLFYFYNFSYKKINFGYRYYEIIIYVVSILVLFENIYMDSCKYITSITVLNIITIILLYFSSIIFKKEKNRNILDASIFMFMLLLLITLKIEKNAVIILPIVYLVSFIAAQKIEKISKYSFGSYISFASLIIFYIIVMLNCIMNEMCFKVTILESYLILLNIIFLIYLSRDKKEFFKYLYYNIYIMPLTLFLFKKPEIIIPTLSGLMLLEFFTKYYLKKEFLNLKHSYYLVPSLFILEILTYVLFPANYKYEVGIYDFISALFIGISIFILYKNDLDEYKSKYKFYMNFILIFILTYSFQIIEVLFLKDTIREGLKELSIQGFCGNGFIVLYSMGTCITALVWLILYNFIRNKCKNGCIIKYEWIKYVSILLFILDYIIYFNNKEVINSKVLVLTYIALFLYTALMEKKENVKEYMLIFLIFLIPLSCSRFIENLFDMFTLGIVINFILYYVSYKNNKKSFLNKLEILSQASVFIYLLILVLSPSKKVMDIKELSFEICVAILLYILMKKSKIFDVYKFIYLIFDVIYLLISYKNVSYLNGGNGIVSALWAVYGIFLVSAGLIKEEKNRIYTGLGLIGVVAIKLIVLDLSDAAPIWKIAIFIGFGIALLGVSYILHPKIQKISQKE